MSRGLLYATLQYPFIGELLRKKEAFQKGNLLSAQLMESPAGFLVSGFVVRAHRAEPRSVKGKRSKGISKALTVGSRWRVLGQSWFVRSRCWSGSWFERHPNHSIVIASDKNARVCDPKGGRKKCSACGDRLCRRTERA